MSARLKEPHVFIVTSEILPYSCCILPDLTDLVKAIQCSTGRFFGGKTFCPGKASYRAWLLSETAVHAETGYQD